MSILSDPMLEARRLIVAANEAGVRARVIGGVAVALHAPTGLPGPLTRSYGDIDLVTPRKSGPETVRFLADMGYEPNERFNAMNAYERLVAYDSEHGRQIDVFVGEFRMCHRLPLAERLDLDRETAPLAELLLTKLQISRVNRKDLQDIYGLLVEHDVADQDEDTINGPYLARLLADDWGLWRTSRGTVEMAVQHLRDIGLSAGDESKIRERLAALWEIVDATPKSRRWRLRGRVGERVKWYTEPEEVEHRQPNHA
jgi:hypothetical protein